MIWRLSKQKWANRGNQKQGFTGNRIEAALRNGMAIYLTAMSAAALFLSVMLYTELLAMPSWGFVRTMLFS